MRPLRPTRRNLLIGGGATAGLVLAWAVWPRSYPPNLPVVPGETLFNAFLKIGTDGHVAVAVGQAEMGQGVQTALAQVLADELGADWRTVAVEPAPIGPFYANDFLIAQAAEGALPGFLLPAGQWAAKEVAQRSMLMITGGSTSIRGFEARYAEAGATARALLCMAAAKRWQIDWQACDTADGFVVRGDDRLRFGELAAEAAGLTPPDPVALRTERRLSGKSVPRIDLPAKVDGTARYAADVRLPDMLYAAIRQRPPGGGAARPLDKAAADRVPGVRAVFEHPGWQAALGDTTWAAQRGLEAAGGGFAAGPTSDATIERALDAALRAEGSSMHDRGTLPAATLTADYRVGLAAHAPIEPMTATARLSGDRLEIWAPTQAPAMLRAAAAGALGLAEGQVTVHPTLHGGSFGGKTETDCAVQAAIIAAKSGKPVQLTWSRAEDLGHDRYRPAVRARMAASLSGTRIAGWEARIAAPASAGETLRRMGGEAARPAEAEAAAVEGALPPYAIPAVRVWHHPADIGVPTGFWRSVANSYTAFFGECFIDELAAAAGTDPLSFRMAQLSSSPRLARCLARAAALGGWEGGGAAQGLAAHSCFGSHVAMLAEVEMTAGRPRVARIAAAVDCGRVINPDIVMQQIEGGIVFGLAATMGGRVAFAGGQATATNFDALALPTLADCPEINITLIPSTEAPGGVGEIAVPPVAPAIANAVSATTGRRIRALPIA